MAYFYCKAEDKERSSLRANSYLQHPIYRDFDLEYDNPHYFKIPSRNNALRTLTRTPTASMLETKGSTPVPSIVDQVFKGISQYQGLQKVEPDPCVITPLLSHQKEALFFISCRERQDIGGEFCLWKALSNDTCTWYRHLITGHCVETTPEYARGGILADEMGLGKTLSMISAILTLRADNTLPLSAVVQPTSGFPDSLATLILVPSVVLIDGWLAEFESNLLQPLGRSVSSGHSTKLDALVQNLHEGINQGKSIVVSFWKTTLDLLEPLLEARGILYVRIDGNVSGNARSAILSHFHTDSSIRVILMTTGTDAVGLNLTVATQVHLLEPQWNPSIESQAIGRVLRITQKEPVTVTRYIMKNTVEESIQERQKKKEDLAALTMVKDIKSEGQIRRRLDNLRSLLR